MVFKPDAPIGAESFKIRHMIVPYTRGAVLDIGCGPWKPWPHFLGVDRANATPDGQPWQTDLRRDAKDLGIFADRSMDAVFSSHLLDELDDPEAALAEWWRVIKPDGHLVLYLPHADHYPHAGEKGAVPAHAHDYFPEDIIAAMDLIGGWDLVENQVRTKREECSFYQVYRKGKGSRHEHSWKAKAEIKQPRCVVARYGGIGDMIQAASIFPLVKEQGYHLTLNCHPNGPDIVGADPHIDAWIVQDPNQVPNHQLGDYWGALEREFDRAINLHESVEGTLLAMPGRRDHAMSHTARHMLMNVNYLDLSHAMADVPLTPKGARFYPRAHETKAMEEFRAKLGAGPVILWSLAGSSIHKFWPWLQEAAAWLLDHTDCKIVYTGDDACQVLEMGICQGLLRHRLAMPDVESHKMRLSEMLLKLKEHWGGVNRVLCRSGSWSIRETLTFVDHADIVVGPETGVLNAAGLRPVAKVVFLSHSSAENLTRDWANTTVLEPVETPCYPCHRLHYGREFCPESHTATAAGASMCAASISWQRVVDAVVGHLNQRRAAA